MSTPITGVQPNHETTVSICTTGRPESSAMATATYTEIKDIEGSQISINGNIVSWNSMGAKGWQQNAVTGKGLTITLTAKRNYGDTANDYIASKMLATGQACESAVKIAWPNGDALYVPCVINVKSNGGGSVDMQTLEADILSDGKPEYVAAS